MWEGISLPTLRENPSHISLRVGKGENVGRENHLLIYRIDKIVMRRKGCDNVTIFVKMNTIVFDTNFCLLGSEPRVTARRPAAQHSFQYIS